MRRTLIAVSFVIASFLSGQTGFAAQCVWGAPDTSEITPSVPAGVSLKSREISIGQPLAMAAAAIGREFPSESTLSSELPIDIDGVCKLKFVSQIIAYSRTGGRLENSTAQFGSPVMGSQLLAFERKIEHTNGEEFPLIDEVLKQLYERFGEPSASEGTQNYYFLYKDRGKIKVDLEGRSGSHPCRLDSSLDIYKSIKFEQCDFVVSANFDLSNRGDSPALQRYKKVTIQYLDLRRARIDVDIRQRRATKIKEEFAAESRKRPPKDRI